MLGEQISEHARRARSSAHDQKYESSPSMLGAVLGEQKHEPVVIDYDDSCAVSIITFRNTTIRDACIMWVYYTEKTVTGRLGSGDRVAEESMYCIL